MDLTDEKEARIWEHLEGHNQRMPRNDRASKWWNCTIEEAQSVLDEYRRKYGKRIRRDNPSVAVGRVQTTLPFEVVDEGPTGTTASSGTVDRRNRKWTDLAIDGVALVLAVIIDIVLNFVVFTVIAPDLMTKIGMGALSFVVVLFGLRGWIKGGWIGLTLWAMFAMVVTFSDLSFALYVTDVQTRQSGVDTELTRLTKKVEHDQKAIDVLQAGYNAVGSGMRSELAVRQTAIEDARKALESSESARREYLASKAKDENKGALLTADGVFSAIPSAVVSGRWAQLVFFSLIFLGLQGTMVVAATSTVKKDFA